MAAVVVELDEIESVSWTAPTTEVVAAAMEMTGAVPPDDAIGALPVTSETFVSARSYAALTAVGVAAKTLEVVEVESESCTAPTTAVVAAAMLIAGVDPPEEAIGDVPVTEVTVPVAGAAHFNPVASAESAVKT